MNEIDAGAARRAAAGARARFALGAAIVAKFASLLNLAETAVFLARHPGFDWQQDRLPDGSALLRLLAEVDPYASIFAFVAFAVWLHGAAAEVWRRGEGARLGQKPYWGVLNFFIPVWSMFMPFVFLRRLWRVCAGRADGAAAPPPRCLWLFLAANLGAFLLLPAVLAGRGGPPGPAGLAGLAGIQALNAAIYWTFRRYVFELQAANMV